MRRTPDGVTTMTRFMVLAVTLLAAPAGAQEADRFAGRLSVLPVDFATYRSLTGSGEAHAILTGRTLTVTGAYDGVSSPATAVHIHRAPPGRRGPVAFALESSGGTSGEIGGRVELDDVQIDALRNGEYYVQLHTENNPEGEIRGWLLSEVGPR